MKLFKNLLCLLLILSMFNMPADASPGRNTPQAPPVWTVAWVIIPQVRVNVGNEVRTVNFPDYRRNFFVQTASVFKHFIETHTNRAVEIQVTFIDVGIVPEFDSEFTDRIGFRARLTPEIKDRYNIENYDTWMVGWPFHRFWELDETNRWFMNNTNRNWNWTNSSGELTSANLAYDIREIYLEAESSMDRYGFTSLHEFLHITEFWFRDALGFSLPFDVEGSENGHWALHNPGYFGYGPVYNIVSEVDFNFFIDWLGNNIRDPRYRPRRRGSARYLGIPAEAWQQSPTRITVTFDKNNGSVQTDTVHTRTRITSPAVPEYMNGRIFRGWHHDENLTVLARFPHDVVGNVTFFAKWGYESGYVPSDYPEAYIDLNNETLVLPSSFVRSAQSPAYSTNGGRTWQQGEIAFEQFPRMLDRGLSLVITNTYDTRTRRPARGAWVITFEPIARRPRTNPKRLRASYNNAGGEWVWQLARNGRGAAIFEGYQITPSSSRRLPPISELDWQAMPEAGVPALPYGRIYYFVRSVPVTDGENNIPASRPFRISPLSQERLR